jgi:hypothetical protein
VQSSSLETIENTINPQRYYDTQSLAIFVGATGVPISLVDNEEFRELLQEMDRKFKVPHRKVMSQEISKIYSHLNEKIQCLLEEALTISICADIWSKPGMTASYLGVTAHFFTFSSNRRHSICIALKRFPSPHTGMRIADLLNGITAEWKLPGVKVFRVFTDNGSKHGCCFQSKH